MWTRALRASERLPAGLRVASIVVLPFVAFATNAALGTPAVMPLFTLFVVLTGVALWTHLPVLTFDGPLPFSDQGIHVAGEVYPWERVAAIEPGEGRNLLALLDDGQRLRLRVRGDRTHEQFRELVERHKPEAVRF
jgi:hypothetical protein